MRIEFKGLDKLNAKLKKAAAKIPVEKQRFLSMEGELLLARVKPLTPVDTGRLRYSWEKSMHGDSCEVGNNTEYAPFVELGHRQFVYGKDTGRVTPGVHMLRDAVDDCNDNFAADCQALMSRLFT